MLPSAGRILLSHGSSEGNTVEFVVDYIGSDNPEEELEALGKSTVNPTVNIFVELPNIKSPNISNISGG